MLSHLSHVLFCNAMGSSLLCFSVHGGFSRQEYWSGLSCLPLGDLLDPGIKPASPATPELQADSLLLSHRGTQGSYLVLIKRDTGSDDWINQTLESFFLFFIWQHLVVIYSVEIILTLSLSQLFLHLCLIPHSQWRLSPCNWFPLFGSCHPTFRDHP